MCIRKRVRVHRRCLARLAHVGSFFSAIHSTIHFHHLYRSSHTFMRKFWIHIEMDYQLYSLTFTWSMSHGVICMRAYQVQKSEGNLFRLAVVSHTYRGIVPGERHPHRVTTNTFLYHLP